MKTSGGVKAQVFVQAFAEGCKNNQFMQVRYAAGEGEWVPPPAESRSGFRGAAQDDREWESGAAGDRWFRV